MPTFIFVDALPSELAINGKAPNSASTHEINTALKNAHILGDLPGIGSEVPCSSLPTPLPRRRRPVAKHARIDEQTWEDDARKKIDPLIFGHHGNLKYEKRAFDVLGEQVELS